MPVNCVLILGFTHCLILLQIIPNFFPPLEGQVRQGVFNSLNFIMEKRVLALVYLSHTHTHNHYHVPIQTLQESHLCDPAGFKMLIMLYNDPGYLYHFCSHLAPLFDNPKLDRELRSMLRERFPEFCSSPSPPTEGQSCTPLFIVSHVNKQMLQPNLIYQKCYTERFLLTFFSVL